MNERPNTRRDKLAEEECSKHDPSLEHWDDREAFKAGYAAARADARADAQKLVEALKYYASGEHAINEFNDGGHARQALAEWGGGSDFRRID